MYSQGYSRLTCRHGVDKLMIQYLYDK